MQVLRQQIVRSIKILCVGLLVHFFLHTRVTFGWGREVWALWAWKELLIAYLIVLIGVAVYKTTPTWWMFWWTYHSVIILLGVILFGMVGTLLVHLFIVQVPLIRRAMAMRYDYLGFILLAIWRSATYVLPSESTTTLLKWYARVVKRVLVAALIRRCIVAIKPGTLQLFWFNNYVFEGTVGMQPPAVYYTHINYGLPRSQFWFERPTTFWFWLTAFFPLFFFQFLRRRPRQETWAWRAIYWLNVIITFSRAAWWSWIIAVLVAIWLTSNLPRKKLLIRYWIPLFVCFGIILFVWREQIALRWYSNYGHMTMVQLGWEMFVEKPLWWRWWASVWPWSHRDGWLAFNPENQFLQIIIEFWVLGALPWLALRWWTIWKGTLASTKRNQRIMAFSIGMITLTVSGMVLHSFADRMVVYPFMLLFWIALWACTIPAWEPLAAVSQQK